MKKLIIAIIALFAFVASAFAAVDINKATQAELEAIKGLGPVKAKAIIDYRTKNGAFKSAEDIDKVKGIGAGTLGKIASEITIDGKPVVVSGMKPADAAKKPAAKKAEAAAPAAAAAAAMPADTKEAKPKKP